MVIKRFKIPHSEDTGIPHYLQTFYLRISLFTLAKNGEYDNLKNELFILKSKIHGPKWSNVSIAYIQVNMYWQDIIKTDTKAQSECLRG